jgi:hypothetical protein
MIRARRSRERSPASTNRDALGFEVKSSDVDRSVRFYFVDARCGRAKPGRPHQMTRSAGHG